MIIKHVRFKLLVELTFEELLLLKQYVDRGTCSGLEPKHEQSIKCPITCHSSAPDLVLLQLFETETLLFKEPTEAIILCVVWPYACIMWMCSGLRD